MENTILIVKSSGRYLFLDWNNIVTIEAEGNYIRIHTGENSHLIRESLQEICDRLKSPLFVRISRSTIINIHYIRELRHRHSRSTLVLLTNNHTCTWSRSYRSSLNEMLERLRAEQLVQTPRKSPSIMSSRHPDTVDERCELTSSEAT